MGALRLVDIRINWPGHLHVIRGRERGDQFIFRPFSAIKNDKEHDWIEAIYMFPLIKYKVEMIKTVILLFIFWVRGCFY